MSKKHQHNFNIFYPYRMINAIFNRLNLRLLQKSWSHVYILSLGFKWVKHQHNFNIFYPYRVINAIFNRLNLRLLQKSWSQVYMLTLARRFIFEIKRQPGTTVFQLASLHMIAVKNLLSTNLTFNSISNSESLPDKTLGCKRPHNSHVISYCIICHALHLVKP